MAVTGTSCKKSVDTKPANHQTGVSMRDAIKEDVVRLICRFERLSAGSPECAAIMRKVAVYCLSLRYSSYANVCDLLEKYLAEYLSASAEPVAVGGDCVG
jgi:hypothetical protein